MLSASGLAQTCCSGGIPLSNNVGGLPLSSRNTWQFSINGDLNILKTVKEGTRVLDDHSRNRKTFSLLFKTTYSITDNFFLEGLFSWVQQERTIEQVNGFHDFDRTRGLGDGVILLNYHYLTIGDTKFIMAFGPKIPIGAYDLKDDRGLNLNADLQPGSGAWDGVFLHRIQGIGKSRPSRSFFANFTYRFMGENKNYLGDQVYRFGNETQLMAGVADQFLIGSALISPGLNARYRSVSNDRFNRELLPNTGGSWLFVMPAIGWHVRPDMMLTLNAELPVYANIIGTQLSPTLRINGGIFYSFSKKSLNVKGF
jgi:hypothetical protein